MDGRQGPRVVALGGGHGLAASLRAARRYAGEITAVVSVADDGGSSGRLREVIDMPAPGDIRRCLVALGDPGSVWTRSFEHRFEHGELAGHAVGNLVLAGLAAATGDFAVALDEAERLVGAVGRVLPATSRAVDLVAEGPGGRVTGQVNVASVEGVTALSLAPPDAPAAPGVVEAIAAADQVVLGPGSLFTSVLAALVVDDIRAALADTRAQVVYVCNLAPQEPETTGFDVARHVRTLAHHGVAVDTVLCHDGALPVGRLEVAGRCGQPPRVVAARVARPHGRAHDPVRLAAALADLVG
jgi:uncharacterized cofD-like protein